MSEVKSLKDKLAVKRSTTDVVHSEEEITTARRLLQPVVTPEVETPKTTEEKLIILRDKIEVFLSREMSAFHLKIKMIGDNEFIIYQGSLGNVWARIGTSRMRFNRTSLERRLEREGLIKTSDFAGQRR